MKKYHILKSASVIALVGSMVVSMVGCGSTGGSGGHLISISNGSDESTDLEPAVDSTGLFNSFPSNVPLSDREWITADSFMEQYTALADQIEDLLQTSGNEDDITDLCDQLDSLYIQADAWYVFCSIDAEADPDTYQNDESEWIDAYTWLYEKDWEVYHALLTSDYAETVIETDNISESSQEYYINEENDPSSGSELSRQENELVSQYNNIAGTYNDYSSVDDYNAEIYNIYSQLVAVRQQMAEAAGYSRYDDYAYEVAYGRDFTPDDVDSYYQNVVNYWVPVTEEFNQLVSDYDLNTSGGPDLTDSEITGLMHTILSGICDDYNDLEEYMEAQQLLTIGDSETGSDGGVTIDLTYYGSAAVYASGDDGLDLLSTALHEFGHFANDCLAPDTYDNYDVHEVHSTGMQILSTWYAGQTLGEYAQDYTAQQINFLLWYVGSQAATDAFERAVYKHYAETGTMYSFDELCTLYDQFFTECGNEPEDSTLWTEDSFLFENPCYSLSYSISASTSLSMLSDMDDDFAGTVQKYLNLVAETDTEGYVAAMEEAGMPNVLDSAQSEQTAEGVIEYARNFCVNQNDAGDTSSAGSGSGSFGGSTHSSQTTDTSEQPALDEFGNTTTKPTH